MLNFKKRKIASNILKIIISCALLFWLYNKFKDELIQIPNLLNNANWLYIILGLLSIFLCQLFSVFRWKVCTDQLKLFEVNNKALFKMYFISIFLNNFLPTNLAGDFIRAYLLKKDFKNFNWINCATSVFIDRISGLILIAFFALLSVNLLSFKYNLPKKLIISTDWIFFSLIIFIITMFVIWDIILKFKVLKSFFNISNNFFKAIIIKISQNLNKINRSLKLLNNKGAILFYIKIFLWSLSLQFLAILALKLFCLGLNFNFDILELTLFHTISVLGILVLPNISGIGIREGIYANLALLLGLSASQGITLSLFWLLGFSLVSLIGVPFLINSQYRIPE